MRSINFSGYKQYMPWVGFLAAVYTVYSGKANGFSQLWTDVRNIFTNPSAFFTKVKNNIQYVIAAIVIFVITPKLAARVSNRYAKMGISLIGNYAGSYLILKYIIDPPEDGSVVIYGSGAPAVMWGGANALTQGRTQVMGTIVNTYGSKGTKY